MRSGSAMIEPTRRRGFSEPYGSWKIIWMRRRSGRSWPRLRRADVLALELDQARVDVVEPAGAAGQRRLAAAGLADQAERLAPVQLEADALDGVHVVALAPEQRRRLDREALDHVVEPQQDLALGRHARVGCRRAGRGHDCTSAARRRRSARPAGRRAGCCPRAGSRPTGGSTLPRTGASRGTCSRHTLITWPQRGTNEQPRGRLSRLGGWPGIECRCCPALAADGIEPSRPAV